MPSNASRFSSGTSARRRSGNSTSSSFRGGTVARARGLSSEEAEKFLHITIQPEKDVVLILTAAAQKQSIMKAICNEAFARTGERGIAFSVPVSDVTGLDLARLAGQAE